MDVAKEVTKKTLQKSKGQSKQGLLTGSISNEGSSDRSFGLVFAAFFALIGLKPVLKHAPMHRWSIILSSLFFIVSFARPHILAPLNKAWTAFGHLLSKVTNPIVMGIVFFVLITPLSLIFRLLGKDPLGLSLEKQADTYWIVRESGQQPNLERQF